MKLRRSYCLSWLSGLLLGIPPFGVRGARVRFPLQAGAAVFPYLLSLWSAILTYIHIYTLQLSQGV